MLKIAIVWGFPWFPANVIIIQIRTLRHIYLLKKFNMTKCKFSVGKYERMKKSEKEETPKQTWTSILSVKRFTLIFQHNQCLPDIHCQSTNYLMSELGEGLTDNHFCLISSSVFLQDTFNAASKSFDLFQCH